MNINDIVQKRKEYNLKCLIMLRYICSMTYDYDIKYIFNFLNKDNKLFYEEPNITYKRLFEMNEKIKPAEKFNGFQGNPNILEEIKNKIENHKDIRFGQILCNMFKK